MHDPVTNPAHYVRDGELETIDKIRDHLTAEQFIGYCLGNAIKYFDRAAHKGNEAEDLAKCAWYLRFSKGDDPRHER